MIRTSGPEDFVYAKPTSLSYIDEGEIVIEVKTAEQAVIWIGETPRPGLGATDQGSSYGITLGAFICIKT